MRPAYMFAEKASQFESRIEVAKDSVRIDGKSVLSILTLGAAQGSEVSIEATGEDAQHAVDALAQLVSSGFVAPEDA
jgi:phosphocarrier protein HPr